ncbi:MAG TPA: cation transporter [Actinopolymorphaceae bacterium]
MAGLSGLVERLSTERLPVATELERRNQLARRIRWLVMATISYNVIEAVVAIIAGTFASSMALIGFGLDSVIEVSSAAAVAWQFSARDPATPEARERRALRIIAISFFALAGYVAVESIRSLLGAGEAEHSTVGLVLAALSLAVMPVLSYAQRRAGRQLGSASAVADSKQTLLCTYLSAVLLVGLALNSLFGWSWADPLAALVIAGFAVKEGVEAWRGDACCTSLPVTATAESLAAAGPDTCGCAPGRDWCTRDQTAESAAARPHTGTPEGSG